MAAKGHHFPRLTVVGVVDADLGLGGADLRAGERTYQLLTQVAGRAGPGRPARACADADLGAGASGDAGVPARRRPRFSADGGGGPGGGGNAAVRAARGPGPDRAGSVDSGALRPCAGPRRAAAGRGRGVRSGAGPARPDPRPVPGPIPRARRPRPAPAGLRADLAAVGPGYRRRSGSRWTSTPTASCRPAGARGQFVR